jgi:putative hydrolases of HD superfamily
VNEKPLDAVVDLLFEASLLKDIPRSGFAFLGAGRESVAEHCYLATFVAFVLCQLHPEADCRRLLTMCLLHDLPEARTGDLNYVQKKYVQADEASAVKDMVRDLPFAEAIHSPIIEYTQKQTLESKLAHDADQLSLLITLKALKDAGSPQADKWIETVKKRIVTQKGRELGDSILNADKDRWWHKIL